MKKRLMLHFILFITALLRFFDI